MSENDPGSVSAMRDLLNKMKEVGGPNWAEDLAAEITQGERKSVSEALDKDKNAKGT